MIDYQSHTKEGLKKTREKKKVTESMYARIFTVPSVGSRIHDDGVASFYLAIFLKTFSIIVY